MSAKTLKICHGCGNDVSQVKRTKDTQGRYYCNPCWETASRSRHKSPSSPEEGRSIPRTPLVPKALGGESTGAGDWPQADDRMALAGEPEVRREPIGAGRSSDQMATRLDVTGVPLKPVEHPQTPVGWRKVTVIGGVLVGIAVVTTVYLLVNRDKAKAQRPQVHQLDQGAPAKVGSEIPDAAARERKRFIDSVAPFVKVAKSLRSRAGTDFKPAMELTAFAEKVGSLEDAFTEIGTPPDGPEFTEVTETAKLVLSTYKTCLEARQLSASAHRTRDTLVWVEADGSELRARRRADKNIGLLLKILDLAATPE